MNILDNLPMSEEVHERLMAIGARERAGAYVALAEATATLAGIKATLQERPSAAEQPLEYCGSHKDKMTLKYDRRNLILFLRKRPNLRVTAQFKGGNGFVFVTDSIDGLLTFSPASTPEKKQLIVGRDLSDLAITTEIFKSTGDLLDPNGQIREAQATAVPPRRPTIITPPSPIKIMDKRSSRK